LGTEGGFLLFSDTDLS